MNLKLKQARKENGYSQADLANALNVDIKTVGNWERGKTLPDIEQLWKCAKVLHTDPNDLLGWYEEHPEDKPSAPAGAEGELIGSPKLDDLACAFALTEGFLQSSPSGAIPVLAVFDNEEVGSETKQGAASNFLRDTLRRLTLALGKTEEDYLRWCAGSFLVSADNAHAQHPNHPEFADAQNTPYLNGGVVVKFNANQRYATDAVSAAAFRLLCRETGEQTQTYANRSDLPGGSTLGSISDTRVAVPTVDIGLAQLAMHSAYETMGARDLDSLVRVMTAYFGRTPRWNAGAMQLV